MCFHLLFFHLSSSLWLVTLTFTSSFLDLSSGCNILNSPVLIGEHTLEYVSTCGLSLNNLCTSDLLSKYNFTNFVFP